MNAILSSQELSTLWLQAVDMLEPQYRIDYCLKRAVLFKLAMKKAFGRGAPQEAGFIPTQS